MPRREQTIYLIDGSAQVHRAFFAIRGLATTRGMPTGGVYGFTTMLRKLYQDEEPEWVAISFDLPGATFRHEQYREYKATRRRMDDDLAVQLPFVHRVCEAFGLPRIDVKGFEADDVIATLARQAVEQGYRVVVVSGDKDLLQLVSDEVLVLNPGREGSGATLYDRKTVEEKFGVPPERVVDVLALVGDSVDNVPGVPGIGDKGARDLIREYGSLEGVLENAEQGQAGRLPRGADQTRRGGAPVEGPGHAARGRAGHAWSWRSCGAASPTARRPIASSPSWSSWPWPRSSRRSPRPPAPCTTWSPRRRRCARSWSARARPGSVSVALLRAGRDPMRARIVGLGLASEPSRAIYVPFEHAPFELDEVLPARAGAGGAAARCSRTPRCAS